MKREVIHVKGIVQGVGFRPFVYKKAKENSLKGWVKNTTEGVVIDIEGEERSIENFLNIMINDPPKLANITEIRSENKKVRGYTDFSIRFSEGMDNAITNISPDIAMCEACKRDIENEDDRRFQYPFTNCTDCGPRVSIIKKLPYDRKVTTMKNFIMCPRCQKEYDNPEERRFHAQPNACPICGPQISILSNTGEIINVEDKINFIREKLRDGNILAIKGLGGFHLVCDAENSKVIEILRKRKNRPNKPLAVMMKDIDIVNKHCNINNIEEKILIGNKKPIILLEKKEDSVLPMSLSTNKSLGVMLPYTPLHSLIFDKELNVLVMTSANRSGEPMVYKNESAIEELRDIVDYIVVHNRDIYLPIDDSVSKVVMGEERLIRPARGYAPITNKISTKKHIVGFGAQLKNTFSFTNGESIVTSNYIGDMDNYKTQESFEKNYNHFMSIYNIKPDIIAYDMHPDFWYKDMISNNSTQIKVQHHHAHIASCLFENNVDEDVIGIAFDGSGYGDDKNIWGGEFFICNKKEYRRVGHLNYVNIPGGESAIKEPWKISVGYLIKTYGENFDDNIPKDFDKVKSKMLYKMIMANINSPLTSSMGRLFDGVAGLLGFNRKITYEGEAAIYLERIADNKTTKCYDYSIDNLDNRLIVNTDKIIISILNDIKMNVELSVISTKFHNTIVKFTCDMCLKLREINSINKVALSGGVFANELLLTKITSDLIELGFKVYSNKIIPTNDSGISVGQVVVVNSKIEESI